MKSLIDAILLLIENAGSNLSRSIQTAVSLTVEDGSEHEVIAALASSNSVAHRWLHAALVEKQEGSEATISLWRNVVAQNGCEIPDVLVHRARSLARRGDLSGAANLIRLALENSSDYGLYLRAESVARKCKAEFATYRNIKVALLSSSTTALLRSVLEMQFLRDGIHAKFYEPAFGTYAQELADPDSELRGFQPDFIILLLNWRDLGLPPNSNDTSEVDGPVRMITQLWHAAPAAKLIQLNFVAPPYDGNNALSSLLEHGRSRRVRQINEALYEAASERVILLDAERIATTFEGGWEDPILWSSAKTYPAPAAHPILGEHISSTIRAELGLSRKLLVLDADNTLWGGVVGEEGIDGIRLGPPSAIGERYVEFQKYLKDLKNRGVLLALVSKNNIDDVINVLKDHPSSVLKPEDFVSLKVNWSEKSANIKNIASELRLGLESFVFFDDNPAERSAVRRDLPQVIVPELSGEPSESIAALERRLYFQAVRLTREDKERNASYRAAAEQAAVEGSATTLDGFLASLNMSIDSGFVNADTITRVTQLINKTNQFNLTTPRYSQAEVLAFMDSPDYWCRWYRLKDRFADHGLIGVLIARLTEKVWTIDTWLMSCRVIGREVESFMFRDLILSATKAGATSINATYSPTAKNSLVSKLLPRFDFVSEASGHWKLDLRIAHLPPCRFFQLEQKSAQD